MPLLELQFSSGNSKIILSRHKRDIYSFDICKGEFMCRKKEKLWFLSLVFCLVLVSGCGKKEEETFLLSEAQMEEAENSEESESAESGNADSQALDVEEAGSEVTETIYVYVCGQVHAPGVYELDTGSRIYEAVLAAGGMLEDAAEEYVNQAAVLEDGQKIYIPSQEEVDDLGLEGELAGSSDESAADDGKVNINTAGKEELMTLTGIGEKRAEAILAYREAHGSFENTEALMQVDGIKQGTYDKIKDQIKVS